MALPQAEGCIVKIFESQEALLHLYLRLNGYFTTSFIVHSAVRGSIETQVDALAVRHRFNAEPERLVEPSPFLDPTDGLTDLLVCEVKGGRDLEFNVALREDIDAVRSVVRWAGLFPGDALPALAAEVQELLQPGVAAARGRQGVTVDRVRVRALLCCPERDSGAATDPWFLAGSELFGFVTSCLRPTEARASCSTQYDLSSWGSWLQPVVAYFKAIPRGQVGNPEGLYESTVGLKARAKSA